MRIDKKEKSGKGKKKIKETRLQKKERKDKKKSSKRTPGAQLGKKNTVISSNVVKFCSNSA